MSTNFPACERILGVDFFNGDARAALQYFLEKKGLLVIPASPPLTKLQNDDAYRRAMQEADVALLDSGLVAAAWQVLSGHPIARVSGSGYLKCVLEFLRPRGEASVLWIVSSERAQQAEAWLDSSELAAAGRRVHVVAPGTPVEDHALLLQIEENRPEHIIIATAGGTQEKLGAYLRNYLLYRPCIHCVGAALAFLTGAERRIPSSAETARLGWLFRFASQPRMILPRIGIAVGLLGMLIRYRAELPPLRPRWADV